MAVGNGGQKALGRSRPGPAGPWIWQENAEKSNWGANRPSCCEKSNIPPLTSNYHLGRVARTNSDRPKRNPTLRKMHIAQRINELPERSTSPRLRQPRSSQAWSRQRYPARCSPAGTRSRIDVTDEHRQGESQDLGQRTPLAISLTISCSPSLPTLGQLLALFQVQLPD